MKLKKNIYKYFIVFIFLLLAIDEISFILYNISLYQIFCGSNFIKIYESFFKLPYNNINFLFFNSIVEESFWYEAQININLFTSMDILNTQNKLSLFVDNVNVYSFNGKEAFANKNNIYLIHFDTLTTQKNKILFDVLQNKIYISPGETTLAFFRICNNTNETLRAFSVYVVSPSELTPFINKLQCFCYEELLLYPKETVDLPVLFRLEPDVLKIDNFIKELVIEYIIVL